MDDLFLKITYDKKADAAYIYFSTEKVGHLLTESFAIENFLDFGTINIDFDQNQKLYGLEILNASKYLPADLLS